MKITPYSYPNLNRRLIKVLSSSTDAGITKINFSFLNDVRLYTGKEVHFIYNNVSYIARYDKYLNVDCLYYTGVLTIPVNTELSIFETFKILNDNELITYQDAYEKLTSNPAYQNKLGFTTLGQDGLLKSIDKMKVDYQLFDYQVPNILLSNTSLPIVSFNITPDRVNKYSIAITDITSGEILSFDILILLDAGNHLYTCIYNISIPTVQYLIKLKEVIYTGNIHYLSVELSIPSLGTGVTRTFSPIYSIKSQADITLPTVEITSANFITVDNDIELELNDRLVMADTYGSKIISDADGSTQINPLELMGSIWLQKPGFYYKFANINSFPEIAKIGLDDDDGVNLEIYYNGKVGKVLNYGLHCSISTTKSNRSFFGVFYPASNPNTVDWVEITPVFVPEKILYTEDILEREDTRKLFMTPEERESINKYDTQQLTNTWIDPVVSKDALLALDKTDLLIGTCCIVLEDESVRGNCLLYELDVNKNWIVSCAQYYEIVTETNDGLLSKEQYHTLTQTNTFAKKVEAATNVFVHIDNPSVDYALFTNLFDLVSRPLMSVGDVGNETVLLGFGSRGKNYSVSVGSNANVGNYGVRLGININNIDVNLEFDNIVLLGTELLASKNKQIILGNYNLETGSIFVIGDGTSHTSRHNLFEIQEDGYVYTKYGYIIDDKRDDFMMADGSTVSRRDIVTMAMYENNNLYLMCTELPGYGDVNHIYLLKTHDPATGKEILTKYIWNPYTEDYVVIGVLTEATELYKVVTELPAEGNDRYIYLLEVEQPDGSTKFIKHIWIEDTKSWKSEGYIENSVDLHNYYKIPEIDDLIFASQHLTDYIKASAWSSLAPSNTVPEALGKIEYKLIDVIDNYTINTYKISTNPVLNAGDILLTNYSKAGTFPLATTDTINQALGKIENLIGEGVSTKEYLTFTNAYTAAEISKFNGGTAISVPIVQLGVQQTFSAYQIFSSGAGRTSDVRWKTNIKDVDNILMDILKIKIRSYDFDDGITKYSGYGLVAQELLDIKSPVIDSFVHEDENKYYSVDYSAFGFLAIRAIQELTKEVYNLKKEIKNLKDKN